MEREINYSSARAQLSTLLDRATDDREAITITRRGKESVVMLAESEYRSLLETAYLLRSPKNAQRLLRSLADSRAGRNLVEIDIEEVEKRLNK
jgi:antitoxin YefM